MKGKDAKSPREIWTQKVSKHLVGKTITAVEYLSDKEVKDSLWYKTPIAIQLDNAYWLIPMQDDEGNDGGSISTTIREIPIIPVL